MLSTLKPHPHSAPSYKGQCVSRRKTARFRTDHLHPPYPTSPFRWRRHYGVLIYSKPLPYRLSGCYPRHHGYLHIRSRMDARRHRRPVEADSTLHPGGSLHGAILTTTIIACSFAGGFVENALNSVRSCYHYHCGLNKSEVFYELFKILVVVGVAVIYAGV
jgi:hypothetical protein